MVSCCRVLTLPVTDIPNFLKNKIFSQIFTWPPSLARPLLASQRRHRWRPLACVAAEDTRIYLAAEFCRGAFRHEGSGISHRQQPRNAALPTKSGTSGTQCIQLRSVFFRRLIRLLGRVNKLQCIRGSFVRTAWGCLFRSACVLGGIHSVFICVCCCPAAARCSSLAQSDPTQTPHVDGVC